jgi:ribosomal protein L35
VRLLPHARPARVRIRRSSFKERFKKTKNGHFMRMRVGKRHCATAKSLPQRRRLRKKALVPSGRAAIMRKLGFSFKGSGR